MTSFGSVGSSNTAQPISFGGLVSGLNTANMIQQILDSEKGPIKVLQATVTQRTQQSSAIGDISNRLNNLLTSVQNFKLASYTQGKTANVTPGGTAATVAATADASATVGSFSVLVDSLASATHVSSPAAIGAAIDPNALLKNANLRTPITTGTFTVNGQQISVDPNVDTLNAVMTRIQNAVPGSTVSLQPDASGRNNLLRIAGGGPLTLGTGADTSNFLGATNLLASPAGATRTSTGGLGVTQTGATLANATLVTPLSQPSGSFTVNGVSITYDSSQDSLSTVLSRINNANTGVVASYDQGTDKITFVSKTTGSTALQMQDVAGNFLAAIGVGGTAQTLGANAKFEIDSGSGPVTYYSTTNSVSNAVPGVTLNLLKPGTSADIVTVGQDVDGTVGKVKDLISQFNSTLSFIQQQTAFDPKNVNGILAGDVGVNAIADHLRQIFTSQIGGIASGPSTLGELGITFGAVGSTPGTTNTLQMDETKFRAALQANPDALGKVFGSFSATATLNVGGAGGVASLSGSPTNLRLPGSYSLTTADNGNGTANLTAVFTPADGSASITTTATNVAAGGTNTSLIPGVTLTFKNAFTNGTDTIAIATPNAGIETQIEQYLTPLTRTGGVLAQRQDSATGDIKDMNATITQLNDNILKERDRLQAKFSAMELALQRLKSAQSSLTAIGLNGA